jgi:hypothetical protein
MMHQYGLLLEDFQNNGEFINDCVFTMMHHVGGDIGEASALFQPNILKAFSKIWEMDFEICDVGILLLGVHYSDVQLKLCNICSSHSISVAIKARSMILTRHACER